MDDPVGFLRGRPGAVIDEIQRAPGLTLELKKLVDEDPTPGRFLITGSVELFRSAVSPDSLAGRVETIELLPFSQAEAGVAAIPLFLDRAFGGDIPSLAVIGSSANLSNASCPAASRRCSHVPIRRRQRRWLLAYASALAERDISDVAALGKLDRVMPLIEHAAVSAGNCSTCPAWAPGCGWTARRSIGG